MCETFPDSIDILTLKLVTFDFETLQALIVTSHFKLSLCHTNIKVLRTKEMITCILILTLVIRLLSFSTSFSSNSSPASFSSFSESELSLDDDKLDSDSAGGAASSGLELISYQVNVN